jgi:tryptophanyl-tRNA synthetase
MTDDADTIAQKIRRAKTDPEPLPDNVTDLSTRPEADNLVTIFAALSGETREQTIQRFAGAQFSVFKAALVEVAVEHLAPITKRMQELLDDKAQIDAILRQGGERALAIADANLRDVKDIIGLLRP